MTFTTLSFVLFLVIVFAAYWTVRNRTAQNCLLVAASYFFYGWWDWRFCGLMLTASLLDYGVGLALNYVEAPRKRKALLVLSILGGLGMLAFFKYFNFFTESFHALAESLGWHVDRMTLQVVLPVGISFYTFQTMSYTIDVYRRQMRATPHLIEYLAYVSFFPQLVAGPIERATHLLPQFFQVRSFDHDLAVDGCRQMLWGFFKKMVIADNLGPIVDRAYSDPGSFDGADLAMATIFFALQIYCDFSAYSDIAIGLGRLFGINLMRNFAYPYFSQSLGEFWRRWHISLTTWFRDYVYLPLGGNRVSTLRRVGNVLTVFLLSGIWHGAAWTFVVWGLFHGLLFHLERLFIGRMPVHDEDASHDTAWLPKPTVLFRIILTFGLVCTGWILFRAETFSDARVILQKIIMALPHLETLFLMHSFGSTGPLQEAIFPLLAGLILIEWLQRRYAHPLQHDRVPRLIRWPVYVGIATTILLWGSYGNNQFIYFQF